MDPNFRIYSAPEDEIPGEDRARLDGFLRGREEADIRARFKEAEAEMAAKIQELEARRDAN